MSASNSTSFSSIKELAIFVPIFGTAISITYDVGFFWGLDINYFTLFSLTEHIVVALEAMPVALGSAFLIVGFIMSAKILSQREDRITEQGTAGFNSYQKLDWLTRRARRLRRISFLFAAIALAYGAWSFTISALLSLVLLDICVGLYSLASAFYQNILFQPILASSYAIIMSFILTFFVGVDVQQKFVRDGKAAHVT